MQVNLKTLLTKKAVPNDTTEVGTSLNTMTYSELESSNIDGMPEKIVVIDNAEWIAYSESKNIYFSGNSKGEVGKFCINEEQFTISTLKRNRLHPKFNKNFKIRKGDRTMEDVKTSVDNILDDVNLDATDLGGDFGGLGDLDLNLDAGNVAGTETAGTNPLDAFDNIETGMEGMSKDDAKQQQWDAISAAIADVKLADITELSLFNRAYGALYGHITANDEAIKFGTVSRKVPDPATGKPKVVENATQDIKDRVARGEDISDIDDSNFETELLLKKRHVAPGKVLGSVIAIPEGGFKAMSELRGTEKVSPDKDKTDKKFFLYNIDEAMQIIVNLFDSQIPEAKETYMDAASVVKVATRNSTKKDKDTGLSVTTTKFILKAEGRSNLVVPTAYLPLKTYKTVSLDGAITEEEAQLLALSSFHNLYTEYKGSSKHAKLSDEFRGLISKTPEGVFSSSYFTADASARLALNVKPYYVKDANAVLEHVEVPVKANVSKDATKVTYRYVTYDCTGNTEGEGATLNSLALAASGRKFSTFYNAVGGEEVLNKESLSGLKAKKKKKGDDTNATDAKTIRALMNVASMGSSGSVKFAGTIATASQSVDEKIYAARFTK